VTILRVLPVILLAAVAAVAPAGAEPWSRARIARLPDSAFAAVEVTPDGRTIRHLPHHDETGAVDPAHLGAARARLSQVKWLDAASETVARRHLAAHAGALLTSRAARRYGDPVFATTIPRHAHVHRQ
jgi:hypothetical protein